MILTNENYFSRESNEAYFSVSQIKQFISCEECAMSELKGLYAHEKSTSLLVGSFVDAHFSHELDLFRAKNPEIYTQKGSLRAECKQAEEIIGRIERDPLCMRMMDGDRQKIVTGELGGLPFKAKLDCWLCEDTAQAIARDYPAMDELLFSKGAIVDMKIVKDFNPIYKDGEGRLTFVEFWKYDLQLAVYQALMEQKIGEKVPCYILGATKENVPNLGLFQLPQSLMDAALEVLVELLPHIAAVKRGETAPERCEECDWCKQTKKLTCATWLEDWV